ncbi:unnamed protein product, partial [Allacma fusca]
DKNSTSLRQSPDGGRVLLIHFPPYFPPAPVNHHQVIHDL